jgi:hypothetical protein
MLMRDQEKQAAVPCANPFLVVTAYFADAVEARLKQDFELRRKKNDARCTLEELEVSRLEWLERQSVIDPIPAFFVPGPPDGPLEFGGGSWLTSRKSKRSFKVFDTPHGWRPLRVIACMPTQPGNATPGSIQIRSTKRTGAVSFWKRTEPSPQLPESQPSMERGFYVAQINP